MASVSKDRGGWRTLFVDHTGVRRTIRSGKMTKGTAEEIGRHCEALVAAKATATSPPRQTALWLSDLADRVHAKIARVGLTEPREEPEANEHCTIHEFVEDYIADGKTADGRDAAESTIAKWRTLRTHLSRHFTSDKLLTAVTPKDARKFRQYLSSVLIKATGEPMRENSRRKILASAKVVFNSAVKLEVIERNPFAHEASSTIEQRDRDFFVSPAMTERLLDAAPDAQWRLMIGLWRLTGLRKMEVFGLTWGDILKDKGRFRVVSSKTAHIKGRGVRYAPLEPVRRLLEDVFTETGRKSVDPNDPVITRYSRSNFNLHKPFEKIIHEAGLVPWPKLFQNLRASCETEWLNAGIPAHAVARIIGHSVQVQDKHYAQLTDGHFDQVNHLSEKVAHGVAQQGSASSGMAPSINAEFPEVSANLGESLAFSTALDAPERSRTSTSITDT